MRFVPFGPFAVTITLPSLRYLWRNLPYTCPGLVRSIYVWGKLRIQPFCCYQAMTVYVFHHI